jgi:hypothetical protein
MLLPPWCFGWRGSSKASLGDIVAGTETSPIGQKRQFEKVSSRVGCL